MVIRNNGQKHDDLFEAWHILTDNFNKFYIIRVYLMGNTSVPKLANSRDFQLLRVILLITSRSPQSRLEKKWLLLNNPTGWKIWN